MLLSPSLMTVQRHWDLADITEALTSTQRRHSPSSGEQLSYPNYSTLHLFTSLSSSLSFISLFLGLSRLSSSSSLLLSAALSIPPQDTRKVTALHFCRLPLNFKKVLCFFFPSLHNNLNTPNIAALLPLINIYLFIYFQQLKHFFKSIQMQLAGGITGLCWTLLPMTQA